MGRHIFSWPVPDRAGGAIGASLEVRALYWMQGERNGGPTDGIVPPRWDAEIPRKEGLACCRYETHELRNGMPFAVGQTDVAQRSFSHGNLRDSAPDGPLYTFGDASYGTRAGQRYPLWNGCVLFSDFDLDVR